MAWLLLDTQSEVLVEIPVDQLLPETVRIQWDRFVDEQAKAAFAEKFSSCLETALLDCLDADLKPPTLAQIAFAVAISRRLGVPAPKEVFRYCGAMQDFLGEYAPALKAHRTKKRKL